MGIERHAVVAALVEKGFRPDPAKKGADHEWYRLYVNGKKTVVATKVSRGSSKYRDLGDDLVSMMARQTKLTRPQFKNYVACTLSLDGYLQVLREQGVEL